MHSYAKGSAFGCVPPSPDVAMNLNMEPGKWLVDIKPNLNDVHQRVPNSNSCPCVVGRLLSGGPGSTQSSPALGCRVAQDSRLWPRGQGALATVDVCDRTT